MLEDIQALLQFAEAGSIVRAADRLHRTPSAVTRQMQRLEAALNAKLLDRTVKPPRLTPLGVRVVEQSRGLLQRVEALKALAAENAEPAGLLRMGVAHALADEMLVEPVQALTKRFPMLRLRVLSDLTGSLVAKTKGGELDLAAVLLPDVGASLLGMLTDIVATDRMRIVGSSRHIVMRAPTWQKLAALPWVLNPPGCLFRAALLETMGKAGASATATAEIHNMHLQLAFIRAGCGLGLLPGRFVKRFAAGGDLRFFEPKGFALPINIAIVRAGPLGSLDGAVSYVRDRFAQMSRN